MAMADAPEEDRVRGMGEAAKAAEKGMALFAKETGEEAVIDTGGAAAFQTEHEAAMKAKQEEAAALTGKDNKKARTVIEKEASAMKADPKYVDALKIAKGLAPPNGNFKEVKKAAVKVVDVEAAAPEEGAEEIADKKKDDKKPKKAESAGISPAERKELDDLKLALIKKKTELKAEGLSGGACNKDPEVVSMVARLQELKLKEDPSGADADKKKKEEKKGGKKLSADKQAELQKLEQEIEEYRQKLITEFKYTKKEIAADPDMVEMNDKLKAAKK